MKVRSLAVVLTMLLAAAIVSVAPLVEHVRNDSATVNVANTYLREHSTANPHDTEALSAAATYNAELSPRLLDDPWADSAAHTGDAYNHYLSLLADTPVMATLTIPAINARLPIVHGTSDEALLNGVGHFYGSHLPVGGKGTHAVLAGHHTWPGHTYFSNLEDLKIGDHFTIDTYGATLPYDVVDINLVRPDDLAKIQPQPGRDLVTLVTCITPEGGKLNEFRLLVTAERAMETPADAAPAPAADIPTVQIQTWMYPRIITASLALALALIFTGLWLRNRKGTNRA
ncbi:class C sortase [Trueperella pyogenes]|uniref:class C sortase n=1 Tax=Trueperella pyogenes TaxID=1661 RepID=UPI0024BFE2EC|nr:class C sortase [Trueperella pyogenes]WHU57856.1 class C sortase [Trueperella pyogenes]